MREVKIQDWKMGNEQYGRNAVCQKNDEDNAPIIMAWFTCLWPLTGARKVILLNWRSCRNTANTITRLPTNRWLLLL